MINLQKYVLHNFQLATVKLANANAKLDIVREKEKKNQRSSTLKQHHRGYLNSLRHCTCNENGNHFFSFQLIFNQWKLVLSAKPCLIFWWAWLHKPRVISSIIFCFCKTFTIQGPTLLVCYPKWVSLVWKCFWDFSVLQWEKDVENLTATRFYAGLRHTSLSLSILFSNRILNLYISILCQ